MCGGATMRQRGLSPHRVHAVKANLHHQLLQALGDGVGVHAKALLGIVGAQHEDHQIQRIVRKQAGRQIGRAALIAALHRIVETDRAPAQPFFQHGIIRAQQRRHPHGIARFRIEPAARGV